MESWSDTGWYCHCPNREQCSLCDLIQLFFGRNILISNNFKELFPLVFSLNHRLMKNLRPIPTIWIKRNDEIEHSDILSFEVTQWIVFDRESVCILTVNWINFGDMRPDHLFRNRNGLVQLLFSTCVCCGLQLARYFCVNRVQYNYFVDWLSNRLTASILHC